MQDPQPAKPETPGDTTPCHEIADLLGADGRAFLRHDGTVYILRITRNGKLILTK